jgi:methylated-DNA-[protein]-cysteine S-methyltransferase
MKYFTKLRSPIGTLTLSATAEGLTGLHMGSLSVDGHRDNAAFREIGDQLDSYWAGEAMTFDVELAMTGTPFQLSVWAALRDIPYGTTISYGTLAKRIDNPRAVRAVGRANGRNPIAIIVPCHRVIGSNGSLTGFGGGIERKKHLLDLESRSPA